MVKRLLVSLAAACFISGIVFITLNDFGIVWDEPIHYIDGIQYVAWLKHPVLSDRFKFFAPTELDVHPPFRKLIAAITHEVLTNNLGLIDNTRGFRISSLLFVFPLVFLLTYVAVGMFGMAIGLLVPLMFSFMPHVLFLTPIVTMDYAITALWFIAVMSGLTAGRNSFWLVVSGVSIGLTMLTKLHGFLLFVPVCGYLLWQRKFVRAALVGVIAAGIYVAGWPWLWGNTLQNFLAYMHIQTAHGSVPVYVFGKLYAFAPWWYTPVMFLVTTPALILAAFGIGCFAALKIRSVRIKVLLLNALYPVVFFSLPGVYRYDWVRLFLSAYPFVCLIAGYGIYRLVGRRKLFVAGVYALWLVTVYFSVIRIYPWVSSYYNELVGGPAGAHALGLESEWYGNAYLGVLPWMNGHKKDMMCVAFTKHAVDYYQAMGAIEPGVVFGATGDACRYEIVLMRQGYIYKDPELVKLVTSRKPVYAVTLDGVPLVRVYDRTGFRK